MKMLKSNRDIDFISDFDTVVKYPVVTVEKWNKWYSPYLVFKNGAIMDIEDIYYLTDDDLEILSGWDEVQYIDHSWRPEALVKWCKRYNYYIGYGAYQAICFMFASYTDNDYVKPENLPTKELFDEIIIPDNGDPTEAYIFEEYHKDFKFWKD